MLLHEEQNDLSREWSKLVAVVADVADAYGVAITVIDTEDPTTVVISASVGGMEAWSGRRIPRENSITDAVVREGHLLIIDDVTADPRTAAVASRDPRTGPIIAAPLLGEPVGTLRAALIVARTHDQETFDEIDHEMVEMFAAQAGAALALVHARRDRLRLRQFELREHVAAELNDRVLRRLLGVELSLSGLVANSTGEHRRRLLQPADEVGQLVQEVRRTLFDAANHLDPREDPGGAQSPRDR